VNWPRGSQFTPRHTKKYIMVKFRIFIPELWDFIHQIVRDFKVIFPMSRCKLRTPLIEISPKSIQTVRLSIPITMRSLKGIGQGVLNLQHDTRPIHFKFQSYWNCWSLFIELYNVRDFKAIFRMSHCKELAKGFSIYSMTYEKSPTI
jgi:hypothetical protein